MSIEILQKTIVRTNDGCYIFLTNTIVFEKEIKFGI